MKKNLKYIYPGIKGVLKHEGVIGLISRGYKYLLHRFFFYEDYYVVVSNYYKDIDKEVEADYLPKVDNHCCRIISTNGEVDELIADGFDLGVYELNLRISMDKGAVGFCHFVCKELAHYTFLTDNPRGKEAVDPRPFSVDYKNGQMVVGRSLTVPKYRRLHLRNYNGYVMRKYRWERGIKSTIYTLQVNNYPALVRAAKPPDKLIVSRCRLIKILWFKYLKEIEMEPTPLKQIVAQMSGDSGENHEIRDYSEKTNQKPV